MHTHTEDTSTSVIAAALENSPHDLEFEFDSKLRETHSSSPDLTLSLPSSLDSSPYLSAESSESLVDASTPDLSTTPDTSSSRSSVSSSTAPPATSDVAYSYVPKHPGGILRAATLPRTASAPSQSRSSSMSRSNVVSPSENGASTPTVTFAPLPQIQDRKRTSPVPLGVAARSRMLRQRRMQQMSDPSESPYYLEQSQPLPYNAEPQQMEMPVQSGAHMAGTRQPAPPLWHQTEEDEDVEADALAALGRMMNRGAKTLLRSLSVGQLKDKAASQEKGEKKGGSLRLKRSKGDLVKHPENGGSRVEGSMKARDEDTTVQVVLSEPKHIVEVPKPPSPPPAIASSPIQPVYRPIAIIAPPSPTRPRNSNEVDAEKVTENTSTIVQEVHEDDDQYATRHPRNNPTAHLLQEEEGRVWEEEVGEEVRLKQKEAYKKAVAANAKESGSLSKKLLKGRWKEAIGKVGAR